MKMKMQVIIVIHNVLHNAEKDLNGADIHIIKIIIAVIQLNDVRKGKLNGKSQKYRECSVL